MEIRGSDFRVLLHVGPQVRAVLRPIAVAEFDAVPPADQLPTHIHMGAYVAGTQEYSIKEPLFETYNRQIAYRVFL